MTLLRSSSNSFAEEVLTLSKGFHRLGQGLQEIWFKRVGGISVSEFVRKFPIFPQCFTVRRSNYLLLNQSVVNYGGFPNLVEARVSSYVSGALANA